MHVIESDIVTPFDVDRTLVFWVPVGQEPPPNAVEADYYGMRKFLVPHNENIELLRATMHRRHTIVWSGNGFQWVKNVLMALGFKETDPIQVMSKPAGYVDDLPANEWMGQRIWLKPHNNPYAEIDN